MSGTRERGVLARSSQGRSALHGILGQGRRYPLGGK